MGHADFFNKMVIGNPEGEKLVFLHGLMGNLMNWRKVATFFEESFEILLLDQRGHGRSFHFSEGYSPEDYAKDLYEILETLSWKKVHLVGHSLGARNALVFSRLYSERLSSLVLEDYSPEESEVTGTALRELIEKIPTPFSSQNDAKHFFRGLAEKQGPVISNFLYSNLVKKDDTWDWRFFKQGIFNSLTEGRKEKKWGDVRALKVPTLVLRGERSEHLTVEHYKKFQEESEKVQCSEIPEAGHWIHYEQTDLFVQSLKSFWASL